MIIASQKRKENIAEYLLYMWQIEDIIRANNLDIDRIKTNVIDRYDISPSQKKEMTEWYECREKRAFATKQERYDTACRTSSGTSERPKVC